MTDKLLNIESMPSIKLGFTQMGQDDVNLINKYIDDNVDRLPDLSSSLVGQIKQNEKSKQLEFDLNDPVPKKLGDFFIMCAKEYAAAHPLSAGVLKNIGPKEDMKLEKYGRYIVMLETIILCTNMELQVEEAYL